MNTKLMFSSSTDEWETPQTFYEQWDRMFQFDLDPCATHKNHKCALYYTKEDNGLLQDWGGHSVWCNPPYGREIGKWVKKCSEEARRPNTTVVALLPARTDTNPAIQISL